MKKGFWCEIKAFGVYIVLVYPQDFLEISIGLGKGPGMLPKWQNAQVHREPYHNVKLHKNTVKNQNKPY